MTSHKFVIYFYDDAGKIHWNDSDENCDNDGGEYVAPLPWEARHGGWVLQDALTVAVMRAQETGRDSLVLEVLGIPRKDARYEWQLDGSHRRIGNPAKPSASYRVQPDGGWRLLGRASDDREFVATFEPENYL